MIFFNKEKTFQYAPQERIFHLNNDEFIRKLDLLDSVNYKIEFHREFIIDHIADLDLSNSHYAADDDNSQYPENALRYMLPKGTYFIEFFNVPTEAVDKIWTSHGKVDYDQMTGKHSTSIKSNGKTELYIFVRSSAYHSSSFSGFQCKIDKMKNAPKTEKSSVIFASSSNVRQLSVILSPGDIYNVTTFAICSKDFSEPTPKYPTGTYQVSIHTSCDVVKSDSDFEEAVKKDSEKFSFEGKKLSSMKGISIPRDVNPLSYYVLAGKFDALIYFDYANDKYFIQPNGCAEFFVTMLLPEDKIERLEETESYAVYHVVDYEVINNEFANHTKNISAIKQWVKCKDSDIHTDSYQLFYYVDAFGFFDWMHDHLRYVIDSLFLHVRLYDIIAESYDDVSLQKNPDDALDWRIIQCRWCLQPESGNDYNHISWQESGEWTNIDDSSVNQIKMTSTGEGLISITKKHLMLLTGVVDVNSSISGELSDSQFKQLAYLNGPDVAPFDRLQTFTQLRLTSH